MRESDTRQSRESKHADQGKGIGSGSLPRDVLLLLTYDPSEVYTLEPLLAVPRSLFIITVKVNEASVSLRS